MSIAKHTVWVCYLRKFNIDNKCFYANFYFQHVNQSISYLFRYGTYNESLQIDQNPQSSSFEKFKETSFWVSCLNVQDKVLFADDNTEIYYFTFFLNKSSVYCTVFIPSPPAGQFLALEDLGEVFTSPSYCLPSRGCLPPSSVNKISIVSFIWKTGLINRI